MAIREEERPRRYERGTLAALVAAMVAALVAVLVAPSALPVSAAAAAEKLGAFSQTVIFAGADGNSAIAVADGRLGTSLVLGAVVVGAVLVTLLWWLLVVRGRRRSRRD